MLAAAIAVWGANAYRNLQIDTFPDVSPTQVVVSMLAPEPSRAEPDALTHVRFLLHRAPDSRVEVFHRDTRRRAVYRLRGGRMVGLADPP